jgi:hypothetical protein
MMHTDTKWEIRYFNLFQNPGSQYHKKDVVARWAGDEFLILCPSSNEKIGDAIINQIKNALKY